MKKIDTYEIRYSKTSLPVPVVNGIHLHSIYDPKREASKLAEKHTDLLKEKKKILVLGLAFSYHIKVFLETLETLHPKEEIQIMVIEPNTRLYEDCKSHKCLPSTERIEYICGMSIEQLYSSQYFVDYLLNNPGVIAHPSSFNLNKKYYTSLLNYSASTSLEDIEYYITDKHLNSYLHQSKSKDWNDFLYSIKASSSIQNNQDFMFMALNEFDQTQNGERNE